MKVAIVHDWLVVYAGAERVLEQMLACYPQADLYALVDFLPPGERAFLKGKTPRTSAVQRMPMARRRYRGYLPLMTFAVEQFDLSGYDLVISSSHAVAKGVLTGPGQLHVCMCYTPIRYAWDLQHQYLSEAGLQRGLRGLAAKWILHRVRQWDLRTANGVDEFIAISRYIQRRIRKVYRRDSTVIHPPVNLDAFTVQPRKEDFYLSVSRMTPYKKIDLIAEAFSAMPDKKLVIVGDGPEMNKVKARAGSNVTLTGFQEQSELIDTMRRARALVFAAEEDFGIVPLEAQACGTPVIAYGRGGALETVRPLGGVRPTGVLFGEQTTAALREAVQQYEGRRGEIDPGDCRANAERFGEERFRKEFTAFVGQAWKSFEELPPPL